MTLYEIDQRIAALCDPETGEVADAEALDNILMEREEKMEHIACGVKNMQAEIDAIRAEEKNLSTRRTALQVRQEKLKQYLASALHGEKFQSARVQVNFRKTERLEIIEGMEPYLISFLEADGYNNCLKTGETTVLKDELKKLIKSGVRVPFTRLAQNLSMGVK